MKKIQAIIVIGLFAVMAAACSLSGQEEPVPAESLATAIIQTVIVEPTAEPAVEEFPFTGIWFEQDRSSMLVIKQDMLYLHEFEINREVYARIDQVDLEAETIDVFVSGILMGGKQVGYDSPNIQIRYHVNGTVLEFLGQHIDFAPDEDGPVIYIYDEFLNSD